VVKFFWLGFILFLSACNTVSAPSEQVSLMANQETFGAQNDSSYPFEASKFVSLHPDRSLRLNRNCTQILRLNLVQRKGYQDTITELKNRAILMGGNSVSLVSWRELGRKTVLLGNIYMCKGKSFHIHPHPQVQ